MLLSALWANPVEVLTVGGPAAPVVPAVEALTPWDTATAAIGMHGSLDKSQRARFEVQRKRLRTTVEGLVDASILEPSTLGAAARKSMTASAATAFRKAAPLVPAKATAVEAIRRTGRIGIQAPAFKAAAATMKVTMKARVDGRAVTWRNNMTLWLERDGNEWRVLAFDFERVPR
jgi:hypothetical protein